MKFASKLIPYYDTRGFDTLICESDKGLYAIFDGMGVSEGARFASSYAKEFMEKIPSSSNFEELKYHLDNVSKHIGENSIGGTTATIVAIDFSGNLHYVHCGDSRLYILKNNRVKQITADEGVENILYNYIGRHGKGVCQLGYIEADEWDKFMLCSDGVTGDRYPDLIDDSIIEHNLNQEVDPEIICEYILSISTKKDDKSIIIGSKDED